MLKALVPALQQSADLCRELIPFLIYYAFRFSNTGEDTSSQLPDTLSNYFLEVLSSQHAFHQLIDITLKSLDFLSIAVE